MNQCPRCGTAVPAEASDCPSCGLFIGGGDAKTVEHPIRAYFNTVREILLRPTQFYRKLPASGGISGPLAFALVTHWVGAAFAFIWRMMVGNALNSYMTGMFHMMDDIADADRMGRGAQFEMMRQRLTSWFWGTGPVIADPFITLASILFTSFFVFVGARLLVTPGREGAPREITYESAVRIICFGLTPSILSALPIFGGLVASICVVIVTVIGAREVYRTSTGRAVVIALFPKLMFLGVLAMGILFIFVAMMKFFTMAV